eukprot:TRINITY_DN74945_c0_g1_i1.p2 TRINITY_DN74945_c0_g1~~TRINITY_DN74945_c0_g1_i1.p2  ORF type:complete len:134 (-),score=18.31 TRINITY_DN74945_c0_g1_i1:268-669(-)
MISAKDVVKASDIEEWVSAAARAAAPVMMKDTREVLLFAMDEHRKVLDLQTATMKMTMEAQAQMMRETMDRQGQAMIRVMSLGGLTLLAFAFWKESDVVPKSNARERNRERMGLLCGYGVCFVAVLLATRLPR